MWLHARNSTRSEGDDPAMVAVEFLDAVLHRAPRQREEALDGVGI